MSRSTDIEMLNHRIGGEGALAYTEGAVALTVVWGGLLLGASSPLLTVILAVMVGRWAAIGFAVLAVGSVLAPFRHSPWFCRFYLRAATCTGGATIWFSEKIVAHMKQKGFMVCMHPHGVLPLGFSFNGAVRVKCMQHDKYLPQGITVHEDCNGIQAPILWSVPFIGLVLRLWGACTPATKSGMKELLASRVPFGILPGGSEEVAIHQYGEENVYINRRYGFIKYGLQHGYALIVCYTFGENDQYYSSVWLRTLNLWLVKRFGFVLPAFGGKFFFPLLPIGKSPLNTVYGDVVQLPRIDEPSTEDIVKWHRAYVDALKAVFECHKARFGFADRKLKLF